MYLLQFVNYYVSMIYAAFLKGMSVGSPEGYDHLFGFSHEKDYEAGSDAVNEAMEYSCHVEPVRASLPSKLKAERGLVGESLQGDLLYICKQSTEKSLTPAPLNKLLRYKKPLVKHEAYATHKTWMGQSYDEQSLLPSTHVSKHIDELTPIKVLSSREGKQKCSSKSMLNFGKFVSQNSGKLMMLVLTTQVAAVQAFHDSTRVDFVSEGNSTDSFSMIPVLPIQASFNIMQKNTSDLTEIHQYVDISEELLLKILHKSDTIINDLQELANFLSTNKDTNRPPEEISNPTTFIRLSRIVRSLPIEESIMCEIEQVTLINLRNELEATLEQLNEGGSNNCQLNFDSDKCEELIKLVQCGYSHLRDGFIAARENMSEVVLMGKSIAEFKEKYMRLLDDKIKFHSQEYNQKIVKFKTEVQELQNLLNTSISLLKEQRIKSCISEIGSGKIESAIQDFNSLNDDSVLAKIIRSVYGEYETLSQIDNIVNFIKQLPSCVQHNIAYTVLLDEMRKKDHLSSPNVLIVAHAAKSCMGETFMKPYVRGVIDAWAHKVRINKDNAYIIDFDRKHWDEFRANLPDLIDKAYVNELSNVENVIMFVRQLPYIEDGIIGYSSLFNKMRSNGHVGSYQTLILANIIKEYMEMTNYPNVKQYYKDMFNTLRSNLPNSVKGLIWSSRNGCKIYNPYYGEYLSVYKPPPPLHLYLNPVASLAVASWAIYSLSSAKYKIRTRDLVPTDNDDFHWELDMLEKGKYFKIKNIHHDFFLLSSDEKYNSERRHLGYGTCGHCVDTKWRLEPEGDNFLIRSLSHDNYLYADYNKGNNGKRFVFGWSSNSIPDSVKKERRWRIVC
ncbi:uncharacterized protein LOC124171035 [Ischnura elegans]|uniref:uncharacterized protein LOC124171035 n=1 Tax=Ischnura elegans TaxID=197161 RepID=UPI001ED89702|nr:uncharacterized protein LOC124171035 [Ischnura elegans]XP_046406136.1 uncharacterized protein LOC124171035 [Ischnura elegans]